MRVHILDGNLNQVGLIEDYYSLIWTERYFEAGDFELHLPIYYDDVSFIEEGKIVYISDSDIYMEIQQLRPEFDSTTSKLVVTGESLESWLKYRFIRAPIDVSGLAINTLYDLVLDTMVTPSDPDRIIPPLSGTTKVSNLLPFYENQLEVQSVYDACVKICRDTGLGFKVIDSATPGYLKFFVYKGVDRYSGLGDVPKVIFSENFENVISASYYVSGKDAATLVYVLTEDVVYPMVEVYLGDTEPTELGRLETVLETTVDRELDEGNPLTDAEVLAIIQTRGREVIYQNQPKGLFEGDFDTQGEFKYGIDYFVGDLVHVKFLKYDTSARVIEVVKSWGSDGYNSHITMDFVNT